MRTSRTRRSANSESACVSARSSFQSKPRSTKKMRRSVKPDSRALRRMASVASAARSGSSPDTRYADLRLRARWPERLSALSFTSTSLPRLGASRQPRPLSRASEQRALVLAQHGAADHRNRRPAVGEDLVVEIVPCCLAATARAPLLAELADHELAHGVVEVGGIVGTPCRLLTSRADILKCAVAKQLLGLFDRHAMCV